MEHGKINVAVEAYLRAYMQPPLTAEQIYLGQQNNSALPKTREHVVFFLASTRRIGTNVGEQIVTEAGTTETRSYREYVVNVDFCDADYQRALQRAEYFETLGRSDIAVDFFKKNYNIALLYCENMQFLPYTDDTNQYINRYRLPLHLAFWTVYKYQTEYFDKIAITRLENVDVHHKPEKGGL